MQIYESEFANMPTVLPARVPTQHVRQWTKFQQKKWVKRELRRVWDAAPRLR